MILLRGTREQIYSGERIEAEVIKGWVQLLPSEKQSLITHKKTLKDFWFFHQRDGFVRDVNYIGIDGTEEEPRLYVEIRDTNTLLLASLECIAPLIVE